MELNVLEFYSGLGGMHYSLIDACKNSKYEPEVLSAFDINDQANAVYQYNFNKKVIQKLIESVPLSKYSSFKADMWLASPPCQPYTRQGFQKGSQDQRAKSFLFLLEMLPKLDNPPKYILIENVKGFETSDTRKIMMEALDKLYNCQEFLLSPLQFQIPNSRIRYYCLAKLKTLKFKQEIPKDEILNYIPGDEYTKYWENNKNTVVGIIDDKELDEIKIKPIREFLEIDIDDEKYKLSEKILSRYGLLLDIVKPSDNRSCCFTKGYYHYVEGTGSVLQCSEDENTKEILKEYRVFKTNNDKRIANSKNSKEKNTSEENEKDNENNEEIENPIKKLKLRYFSPTEISRLMGFPEEFNFPKFTTLKQQYRLLGNSLNCKVVSQLIKYLLSEK